MFHSQYEQYYCCLYTMCSIVSNLKTFHTVKYLFDYILNTNILTLPSLQIFYIVKYFFGYIQKQLPLEVT